jgi:putative ABC transport system permease protein
MSFLSTRYFQLITHHFPFITIFLMQIQQFKELVSQAAGTLWSHKFRSFLTVLGVVIGTATTIAVSSIVSGMEQGFKEQIEQFGTNTAFVSRFKGGPRFSDLTEEERKRKPITYEDALALAELPLVEATSPVLRPDSLPPVVKYKDNQMQTSNVRGVWAAYARTRDVQLDTGRFFTDTEDEHKLPVCVIGFQVKEKLFSGYDPLGKEIAIGSKMFTIVGTTQQAKQGGMGGPSNDNIIYIPYNLMHTMYPGQEDNFVVMSAGAGNLDKMIDQVTEVLRRRRNVPSDQPDSFSINTASGIIDSFGGILKMVALIIIPITSVALLVGGIGVMNIMLVSVTERTKEIGIRRAIGARKVDIVTQFLLEAIALTGIGGLLGIALGFLVSGLLKLIKFPSSIPMVWVAIGFGASVAIGLIFGLYPAIKAARLDPIEALRYE